MATGAKLLDVPWSMALTVAEEIEELKRKITLLGEIFTGVNACMHHTSCDMYTDGDKKAYKESSQWTIRQNKDIISQLRQENKILRANLSKKMKVSSCGCSESLE